jgi:tetratricopeptide (TPR) repeat protein
MLNQLHQVGRLLELAWGYMDSGDIASSLEAAEQAYKINPQDSSVWSTLAGLYASARLFELAQPFLKKAQAAAPFAFMTTFAGGLYYFYLGNAAKAAATLANPLAAPRTDSDRVVYHKLMFRIAINIDDKASMRRSFEYLKNVGSISAVQMDSLVAATKALPGDDQWHEVENMLANKNLDQTDRSILLLAQSRMQDFAGNYDSAFSLLKRSRDLLPTDIFNPALETHMLQLRSQFFDRKIMDQLVPFADHNAKPVFVVGMPRSGTTLLEQILSAHPAFCGVGELSRFNNLEVNILQTYGSRPKDFLQHAQSGMLLAQAKEINHVFALIAEDRSHQRAVEKTPHSFQAVGFLKMMYPHARFLHLERHPADCFMSSYQNRLNEWHDYVNRQDLYAQAFMFQENYRKLWSARFPDNYMSVSYAELTKEPETTMRKVIAFLEEPWDPSCLTFHERVTSINTPSRQQVRQPVNTKSLDRWKRYEKHLGPLFAELEKLGYGKA